jgi:hypothetical protein
MPPNEIGRSVSELYSPVPRVPQAFARVPHTFVGFECVGEDMCAASLTAFPGLP